MGRQPVIIKKHYITWREKQKVEELVKRLKTLCSASTLVAEIGMSYPSNNILNNYFCPSIL